MNLAEFVMALMGNDTSERQVIKINKKYIKKTIRIFY
jgi:hypothetical protein